MFTKVAATYHNVVKSITQNVFLSSTYSFGNILNTQITRNMSGLQNKQVKIGTHDGIFHCDEVLACYLLKQIPQYSNAQIVRSRDLEVLKDCDIVVDVGGVYDESIHRYDHHQRTFKDTMSTVRTTAKPFNIRLSSAGLIYAHFGEQIIREKVDLGEAAVKLIYEKIYESLIQEIDAIDNGVMMCEGEPLYRISSDISSRVKRLNPTWNAPKGYDVKEKFEEAMDIVGMEFLDKLSYYSNSWWPARDIVEESIKDRVNFHSSGEIIHLVNMVPWQEHLFDLEKSLNIAGNIKFCIFSDGKGAWRVQCVPVASGSFICRKFLKSQWQGERDEELTKVSGIPGCIFCHATGFIGGNKTLEGALEMAVQSLNA